MDGSERMAARFPRDVAVSLAFLTRIPAERLGLAPTDGADLRGAVRSFPVAGALIGLAGGILLLVTAALKLPPLAAALVVVTGLALLTGALHEDGLADTADGIGGGSDAASRLSIMRDSCIGSYGALALILSVGLRASLVAAFLPEAPLAGLFALVTAESLGRAAIVHNWAELPPARPEGLAGGVGRPDQETLRMALVAAIVIGLVGGTLAAGPIAAIVALAAAALVATSFASFSLHRLGGHTGDTLGAVEQLTAIAVLLALTAFR